MLEPGRARARRRVAALREAARSWPTTRPRPTTRRGGATVLDLLETTRGPSGCSTSPAPRVAARAPLRTGGAQGGRAGGARRARRARPRAAQELLDALRGRLHRGEGPRVGARLRGPAAPRPQPAARRRLDPRARAAALPLDHGRRVPGHEPAAVRARRPARRARQRSCSSSATSSSRSTASGTPTSRSSASGARSRRRCCR